MRLPRRETHFCLNTLVGLTKKGGDKEGECLPNTYTQRKTERQGERERERERGGSEGERNTQELATASAALK